VVIAYIEKEKKRPVGMVLSTLNQGRRIPSWKLLPCCQHEWGLLVQNLAEICSLLYIAAACSFFSKCLH